MALSPAGAVARSIVAVALATLAFVALGAPYLSDDWWLVGAFTGTPIGTAAVEILTANEDFAVGEYWRPVWRLSFLLDSALGAHPAVSHAINLALHAGAVGLVFRLARRLVRDAHLAEDLTQEAYAALLGGAGGDGGEEIRSPRALLGRVLSGRWSNRLRGDGARAHRERGAARPEALPGTAEVVAEAESQAVVARLVLELEPELRDVLLLRYHESLPVAEVARRLGIPRTTAQARIERGLEQLRGRLEATHGGTQAWVMALLPWAGLGGLEWTPPTVGAGAGWSAAALVGLGLIGAGGAALWPRVEPRGPMLRNSPRHRVRPLRRGSRSIPLNRSRVSRVPSPSRRPPPSQRTWIS